MKQETEVRCDKDLYYKGDKFGCVVAMNLLDRTFDVKKTKKSSEIHPSAVYTWDRPYDLDAQADRSLSHRHLGCEECS